MHSSLCILRHSFDQIVFTNELNVPSTAAKLVPNAASVEKASPRPATATVTANTGLEKLKPNNTIGKTKLTYAGGSSTSDSFPSAHFVANAKLLHAKLLVTEKSETETETETEITRKRVERLDIGHIGMFVYCPFHTISSHA